MEKQYKKHIKYHKPSTKTYYSESNNTKFNSSNEDFSPKKPRKQQEKYNDCENENNLNNYLNFHSKLDNIVITRKKKSCNAALFKRRSIKFRHDSNKRRISSNLKSNKELENIGKINSSTKCFTPIIDLSSLDFHERHSKKENILNDNFNYRIQQKQIKINLVSLKFKIANDYDEAHSNIFLKEKDECLKKMKLTDKIEENEFELSPISPTSQEKKFGKNKLSNNLSGSGEYLSKLLMEVQ